MLFPRDVDVAPVRHNGECTAIAARDRNAVRGHGPAANRCYCQRIAVWVRVVREHIAAHLMILIG